jgi:hypothetical protein
LGRGKIIDGKIMASIAISVIVDWLVVEVAGIGSQSKSVGRIKSKITKESRTDRGHPPF